MSTWKMCVRRVDNNQTDPNDQSGVQAWFITVNFYQAPPGPKCFQGMDYHTIHQHVKDIFF